MRYNPQVKDHGIIIGCLVFHGLLMSTFRSDTVMTFCLELLRRILLQITNARRLPPLLRLQLSSLKLIIPPYFLPLQEHSPPLLTRSWFRTCRRSVRR